MMMSLLSVAAFADDTDENSANLIVHYDFEGDTLEEQLRDKATGGTTSENLTLFSTKNGANDLTYVSGGVAHIAKEADNYLSCVFDSDMGGDIINTASEMTVILKFKLSGSPTSFVDIIDVNKVTRCFSLNAKGNPSVAIEARATSDMYRSTDHHHKIKDGTVYLGVDNVTLALTLKHDADNGSLEYTSYVSYDDGANYATNSTIWTGIDSLFSESGYISFGKSIGASTLSQDRGGIIDLDDVKIYNKALVFESDPTATSATNQGGASNNNNTPSNTTAAKTTAAADDGADETAAPADETTVAEEEKSGCASSITFGGAMAIVSVVAASGTVITKRKRR